MSAAEAVA